MNLSGLFDLFKFRFSPSSGFEREFRLRECSKRILFLTDEDRATFRLYFDIPLRTLSTSTYGYGLLTHQTFGRQLRALTWRHFESWIFDKFRPDLLVFSRFAFDVGDLVAEAAQKRSVPVVYHIDDDLLNVPTDLGDQIYRRQSDPHLLATRRRTMQAADVIYASTPSLAGELNSQFPGKEILIGPRAPYLPTKFQGSDKNKSSFTIGYMGSKGHQRDLDLVVPALASILDSYPQVRFETFGTLQMPEVLAHRFPQRVRAHFALNDYNDFQKALGTLGWDLGIAPLVSDTFNNCKTPIKFLEYTAAGIPVLASDSPVYRLAPEAEILSLIENSNWYEQLKTAIQNPSLLEQQRGRAAKWCAENHGLEQTQMDLLKLLSLSK